jgi:alpha-1,3-glucosyltransferase
MKCVWFLMLAMQMSAYYAPAFFAHLLGKCLRRKNPIFEVTRLGLIVLGTFAVIWWPFLYSKEAILEVRLLRVSVQNKG